MRGTVPSMTLNCSHGPSLLLLTRYSIDVHFYGSSELCCFRDVHFTALQNFAAFVNPEISTVTLVLRFAYLGQASWKSTFCAPFTQEKSGGRPDHSQVFLGAYHRTDRREASCPHNLEEIVELLLNKCNSGSSSFVDVLHGLWRLRILLCPSVLDWAFPRESSYLTVCALHVGTV